MMVPVLATSDRACIVPGLFLILERPMKHLCRTIAFVAVLVSGASRASAQETCLLYQRGTVECPGYGAPAATAVPGPSVDGGVATIPNATSTTLFGGKVPPNGFVVRVFISQGHVGDTNSALTTFCFVNDNGPANFGVGFLLIPDSFYSGTFESPHGYKPIGPVNIWCLTGSSIPGANIYMNARSW
jgi:hypothetical protein